MCAKTNPKSQRTIPVAAVSAARSRIEAELFDVTLATDSEEDTPHAISSENLVDISHNESYLVFNTNGEFRIETSDLTEIGRKELRICAKLIQHEDTWTLQEKIMPLNFVRCDVEVHDWLIGDVTVPSGYDLSSLFESPYFYYNQPEFNCEYHWHDYAFTSIVDSSGSDLVE